MNDLASYKTIVLANGECPHHPLALSLLANAEQIVCCDGAIRHLKTLELMPTAIVGDGDSISEEDKERFAHLLHPDKSQDYNDLTKAMNLCESHGWDSVAIVGGSGLREDHAIGNVSLLANYAHRFDAVMVTNFGVFTPMTHTRTFRSHVGEAVSIFSFTPGMRLTFHGLKYPVKERIFQYLWVGTLNEALGEEFAVEMLDEGEVVVYQAYKKENQ